jgi:hypothetical protein
MLRRNTQARSPRKTIAPTASVQSPCERGGRHVGRADVFEVLDERLPGAERD